VEGFDNLARAQRLEALSAAEKSTQEWLKRWHARMSAGFTAAQTSYHANYRRLCRTFATDTVGWNRALACLERSLIRMDARLLVVREIYESRADELAAAPEWGWTLASTFARCEAAAEVHSYTPLAGAELEAKARGGLEKLGRAWTWAEFGQYAQAERVMTQGSDEVLEGGDPRSVFELHLLRGWLALAKGELALAESELAPAHALATKLGRFAQMELAFFRAADMTMAADDEAALRSFRQAESLARELVSGGAEAIRVEQGEARLRMAQTQWRIGDADAAKAGVADAWSLVDPLLEKDDPRRLDYLDAAEGLGAPLASAAEQRELIADALAADWPAP
jgi:hypothetical protein